MPSQSIIYYLAKYYILNGQVIYNTWASNNMLCASRNVDAFQLIYLILLSGQASVEIRSESFQLIGICLLQFLFTCLKLSTHSRYHRFAKGVEKITRARSFLKTLRRSTYLLRLYSSCLSLRSKAKVYFIKMA